MSFFKKISPLKKEIQELEELRRIWEKNAQESGLLEDAIDRGWAKDYDGSHQEQIKSQRSLAEKTKNELISLIREHLKKQDRVVENWVSVHLQACQNLLQEAITANNEETGVRVVCIGEVLAGLARIFNYDQQKDILMVNTYYLTNYQETYTKAFEEQTP